MLDDLASPEGVGLPAVHLRLQLVDEDLVERAHHRQHDLRLLVAAVEAIAGTDEPNLGRLDQFTEPKRLESIAVHPTEVVDDEPADTRLHPPLHQHLGHDVAATARERAAHRIVGADVVPRNEDAVATGPLQHVDQLLIERPRIRTLVAEPDVAEADRIPQPPEAGRAEDVDQLSAEPTLEVVGHRLHHRVGDGRHRGSAGQFRPEPDLGLEVGAGERSERITWRQAPLLPVLLSAAVRQRRSGGVCPTIVGNVPLAGGAGGGAIGNRILGNFVAFHGHLLNHEGWSGLSQGQGFRANAGPRGRGRNSP